MKILWNKEFVASYAITALLVFQKVYGFIDWDWMIVFSPFPLVLFGWVIILVALIFFYNLWKLIKFIYNKLFKK